ncbi:MAG: aldo/keto reductase [Oscillospiraceae bacterium]|jgi:L-glyceraldehyde 3-phosphate reductase|nr:aldo/keto reductase [Oscillospiraceae bacterium]
MYKANDKRYEKMIYNRCGKSGLKLPAISLGLWHNFGSNDVYGSMEEICTFAFDSGITHFDLANNYGPIPGMAELNFGRILDSALKPYRDELCISTKAGYEMWDGPYGCKNGSRKYLTASLDQSLKRMGLEYVDIFYHHVYDPETPLEETALALDSAVRQGKALYAGISNYSTSAAKEIAAIFRELKTPFIINQVEYSMLNRWIEDDGLKEFAQEAGFGLIAFSPLRQGLLTDKYIKEIPENSRVGKGNTWVGEEINEQLRAKLSRLSELAETRSQTLAQMALSWILRDGKVTSFIVGASRKQQLEDNIEAIRNSSFSPQELSEIDSILAK